VIGLVVGVVLVLAAGACLAAILRPPGSVAFFLTAAMIGFAEVVLVAHALSFLDAYERRSFLAALAGIAAAAGIAVAVAKPPAPPVPSREAIRELASDTLVAVLLVVVVVELGYVAALAVFTPPVEYDAVTYHLPRAAFWIQRESVGFVPDATYGPIDDFPPNAEIAQSATMLVSGSVRWLGLVQLSALLVATLAIYGIATRIGFARRAAAFGALLFPTLPAVALQAPTAQNDLVVAGLVAATTFFALGRSRAEAALAGLCVALLVGTKVTAALVLPVLLVIALTVPTTRRRIDLLVAGSVGVALGATWYLVALLRDKGTAGTGDQPVGGSDGVMGVIARTTRYLIQSVELPGGTGRDAYVYVLVGVVAGILAAHGVGWRGAVVVAALAALPVAVPHLEELLHRMYFNGWQLVGYDRANEWGIIRNATVASNLQSWYGPVGVAMCLVALVIGVRAAVRRDAWIVLVLVTSPLALVVGLAIVRGYDPFNGRYAMGAVALSAATWGVVRPWSPIAAATVAVAATTVFLSLVNFVERPSGLDLLERPHRQAIWDIPREWAQSSQPEVSRIIGYLDANAAKGSTIGITRDYVIYAFAYVGYPDIEHRIAYADSLLEAEGVEADWAVLPDDVRLEPGWRLALHSAPWAAYQRID
jgi:hypothetical protein